MMYRWYQDGIKPSDRGSAVANWRRGEHLNLHFTPMSGTTQVRNEYGISKSVVYRVFVDNYNGFGVGDRIGTDSVMQFEVTGIVTYRKTQQLEVRSICQRP